MTLTLPLDAEKLIPHRPPMRMIDELLEAGHGFGRARVRFGLDHMGVADGFVLEAALVECVAQTMAAALGYTALQERGENEEPTLGMLTGVSDFAIHRRPEAGSTLLIEAHELKKLGQMRLISARVSCEDRIVAEGQLKIYA